MTMMHAPKPVGVSRLTRLDINWRSAFNLYRRQVVVASALFALVILRFSPGNYLDTLDSLLGRPGDALLLLMTGALVLSLWSKKTALDEDTPVATKQHMPPLVVESLLDTHLELDQTMDKKLQEVVIDTESSALAIISEVRHLHDSASELVKYLEKSSPQANDLGRDIVQSMAYLVDIGVFIQGMPEKMTRDLHSVQSVVQEITELSSLVGSVHAISMQSHLLAINAAIEGSRAGAGGAAFRVVAGEMRLLASNSTAVAMKISQGLGRARAAVESGLTSRVNESTKSLSDVSNAAASIQKLQENFEDMNQYFKTRFAVITQHNQLLAKDIAEVLGHIQYQDVVSQCIERIRNTTSQRNDFLKTTLGRMQQGNFELDQLSTELAQILDDYRTEEDKHRHSARHDEKANGELKFELF
jgi:methyl-accepting chemotaxis protein